MKKILVLFLTLMCCTTFIGCQNIKNIDTELVYESLSDKEEYLFNLTGNRILMYKLKNIPNDKKYEFSLIYEVYENGKKVKEDSITSIMHDDISIESDIKTLGINLKSNQIRYILADKSATMSGSYEVKEDLSKYSKAALTNNTKLTLGTEIYIYYANSESSISGNLPLGVPIDSEVTREILKDNQSTVLIRLSFKEI
ncbi:hypothetical protein [Tepidibacter aestuarii]|uniref:hypothetical protein n=1 Tax=Tepidibacter aestuarii TaxID=2925782 RepID=UPI0020C16F1C|nr:hypothetical protein [Tepidibacter aestuarii]CAH2212705.1 conserved exported protein of unknown function [Tepidibacter aestuarii]